VKLLVDANLAPRLAKALDAAGHQATHVGDVGMLSASDETIFDFAAANNQVILSSDTDFGTILARRNAVAPSLILLRHTTELTVDAQLVLLIANLPAVSDDLAQGAVVTITPDRMRVRGLPLF
jgi:predicted nuclease of predicted toxin-antitoxin system